MSICLFWIRINNHTCYCNLCYKDGYDYNNPRNDPIFVVESGANRWEVNLSSKEVLWAGHMPTPSSGMKKAYKSPQIGFNKPEGD